MLEQKRRNKNKLYSLHKPEIERISKVKAPWKYEFGVKVSVAATKRGNFVVGMQALSGNPYGGYTAQEALM